MAGHPTKDKGDLGVAKAYANLVEQNYVVLFPATEHAPFDLVAYRDGSFHRIQVKYRAATAGAIQVQFRSMWADRNGTHIQSMDKDAIDLVCIYCPDTDGCYYLRPRDYGHSVTLRIEASRNNQHSGVRMASEFSQLPVDPAGPEQPMAPA